jgi:hypothetical protein
MQIFFWIISLLISLGIGYWVYLADKKRGVPYPWVTAGLRVLVIMLTLLLLLAPSITINKNETKKPVVLFLQDNSSSVAFNLKKDTATYKKEAEELLDKLSSQYRVIKWGFGNGIRKDTLFNYSESSTDISSAISQAVEFYGQQNLGAIILATDGRYNQGMNPAMQEMPFTGSLYTVGLGDSSIQKDIRISNVYSNRTVSLNSQFEIRADILAQKCRGYNNSIRLTEADASVVGNTPVSINSDRFDKAISFVVKAERTGLHHYILSAPVADGEQNTVNNRKDVFVEVVSEKKNILIAAASPHPDVNAIREALSGLESFNVVVKTGDEVPSSFSDYQVVILHSLPSQAKLLPQLKAARKPVWLIMGSNSSNALMNELQGLARLNVNPANLQNQLAAYNPSFTSFTVPANINAVIDKMPPLASPAGTVQANPNAQVLFNVRGNQQVPLWMMEQGSVPSALLVGEGLWRWRIFEYKNFSSHNVIDELIRQTVSLLSVNVNDKPFRVELPKHVWNEQEAISFNAYQLNSNNEQVNSSDVKMTITDSAGRKQEFSFERSGTAYKLNIGSRSAGSYNYTAVTNYNGKTYSSSGSFVVHSTPLEMMEPGADYSLLSFLSKKYNGSFVPSQQVSSLYDSLARNPNLKPVIETRTETIPLVDWKWYFFLILLFAGIEWYLRKYWLAQ